MPEEHFAGLSLPAVLFRENKKRARFVYGSRYCLGILQDAPPCGGGIGPDAAQLHRGQRCPCGETLSHLRGRYGTTPVKARRREHLGKPLQSAISQVDAVGVRQSVRQLSVV